jgi:hypothetical protein
MKKEKDIIRRGNKKNVKTKAQKEEERRQHNMWKTELKDGVKG